jgi:ABC-type antimicrobial peptide transport system permease subunit
MNTFLVIIGILIGVILFLYLLSEYHTIKDKIELKEVDIEKENFNETESKKRENKNSEQGLKKRFCPLCGSELGENDSIYAEMYEGESRPKVIIHGCRYCYKPSGRK